MTSKKKTGDNLIDSCLLTGWNLKSVVQCTPQKNSLHA